MYLVVVDGNRLQSDNPHGMSQSEHATSGNNLTSIGTPSGMNLSNGSPMLGSSASTKQPKQQKRDTIKQTLFIVMNKNVPTIQLEIIIQYKGIYGTVQPLQVLVWK